MQELKSVVKNWENSTHNERNEIINNYSKGCIENGDNSFIEILKFKEGILYMDHEDINEPQPFQTIKSVHVNYEWDNEELIYQIEDYKDGITKQVLQELLELNK